MFKEMCWFPTIGTTGEKLLHLRTAPHQPWRPYTAFSEYAVADYRIPGGSKGWATYQKLKSTGWILLPSNPLQQLSLTQKSRDTTCRVSKPLTAIAQLRINSIVSISMGGNIILWIGRLASSAYRAGRIPTPQERK